MSLKNIQEVYKKHTHQIKELGGLILVMGILHENYIKESLENMKGKSWSEKK